MVESDVVKVDSTIENLTDFAKSYGITYQLLKDANPWLRSNRILNKEGREYFIKIPKVDDLRYSPERIKVHDKRWIINP